jgi:hypothetical protein
MAKSLSERESAALIIIGRRRDFGARGHELASAMASEFGLDTGPEGAHRTAASLCRKGLAWRAGTTRLQWYKITYDGRRAVKGDEAGKWKIRKVTAK